MKELDIALLNNEIDIAVHSLKDVPTILPLGVRQGAVLQRGSELDIVIHNKPLNSKENTIATGSLRRKAQWLNKFKTDNIVSKIRNHLIKKLKESALTTNEIAIVLERLNLLPLNYIDLDWMIPAPAQGAISDQIMMMKIM